MKNILSALAIAIIWVALFVVAATTRDYVEVVNSEWGCCTLEIIYSEGIATYTTHFGSNYEVERFEFSTDEELQAIREHAEDVCYFEHN